MSTTQTGSLRARIYSFFYAEEIPFGLAAIRIALPLVLLLVVVTRWPHTRELYSTDGAAAPLAVGYGIPNFLPEFSGPVAVALNSLLVLFLVTSLLGWWTRFSLAASTVLYTYFNLIDCISTMTKYSVIASHVLLLLTLSQCGAVWSVDSWLRSRRRTKWPGEPAAAWARSPVWPRRLIQILIGVVYFGAAITKMHTPAFLSGEQTMFWMMTHVNFDHKLGEYLSLYPALVVVTSYVTIVWEVVFLFTAWRGLSRIIMLTIGVVFHAMTAPLLGLYIFPLVCFSVYLAFLGEDDVRWFAAHWRRWQRRSPVLKSAAANVTALVGSRSRRPTPAPRTALAAFACVAALVAFGGVEIEYWMDPYNKRGPGGPQPLAAIDPERVEELLAPEEPVREVDKFFSVDVGTTLLGGMLVDRRSEFRQRDRLIAQCRLNPPHEDMWVECNLHDGENRLIDRVGHIVTREMFHTNFYYFLEDSLEPGDYSLVVRSAGEEIVRKPIRIQPRSSSPVAN